MFPVSKGMGDGEHVWAREQGAKGGNYLLNIFISVRASFAMLEHGKNVSLNFYSGLG